MSVTFRNNATSTLAEAIDATQTTIVVQVNEANEFPQPTAGQWFPLTLVDRAGNLEIVHCDSRDGASLNVTRGRESTGARAFPVNTIASHRLTAEALQALIVQGVVIAESPPLPPLMNGQIWWESDSGSLFIWYDDGDSAQWVQVGGGGGGGSGSAAVAVGDVAPGAPLHNGQLWFKSNTGNLYIWYEDIDTGQWVQINSAVSGGGGGGGGGSDISTISVATGMSFLPTTLSIVTQSYSVAPIRGGARYKRISKATLDSWGYPAASYFRSVDRFMPDASSDVTNGGYWVLDEVKPSPFMFGGYGDGAIDDVGPINAAIMYLYVRSTGGEVDMSGGRWLVDSANIVMKTGVSLVGTWKNDAMVDLAPFNPGNLTQFKSAIVINPVRTISLVAMSNGGLQGLMLINKNVVDPVDFRGAVELVKAFSGTAVSVGTGNTNEWANQTYVGYCSIFGFQFGIKCLRNSRMNFEHIKGDCTTLVHINECHDWQHMSHCQAFPFLTADYAIVSYAVSGAADNGSGLIRLTIGPSTPAGTTLLSGDIVNVAAVGGVAAAAGRWTVTVVDSTHIDLQGTVFAGTYTAGGSVVLNAIARHGSAYVLDVVDWAQADNCAAFGFDVGFDVTNSSHGSLLNCSVDHYANALDPVSIGIRLLNSTSIGLVDCHTAAAGYGIWVDIANGRSATITAHDFWGLRTACLYVKTGYVSIANSILSGTPTYGILVEPDAAGICAVGNRHTGGIAQATLLSITGAALRGSTVRNNSFSESSVGDRSVAQNSHRSVAWEEYGDITAATVLELRKARGSIVAPTAAANGDPAGTIRGWFWDGVDQFRVAAAYRIQLQGSVSATSVPGVHVWQAVAAGSTVVNDIMALNTAGLYPSTHLGLSIGTSTSWWQKASVGHLGLVDGMTAPANISGQALIYVDSADGDLKVKFADGVTKTLAVDT